MKKALLVFCFCVFFSLFSFALPFAPVVISSVPVPDTEYTTAPQYIPYRLELDTSQITAEVNRRGEGSSTFFYLNLQPVDNPEYYLGSNEYEIIEEWEPFPPERAVKLGKIVSKRLNPGHYKIVFKYSWKIGNDPYTVWEYDIPITLNGPPAPPLIAATFAVRKVQPANENLIRFLVGQENSFPAEINLEQVVPGKRIISFGNSVEIKTINGLMVAPAQAEFNQTWDLENTVTGTTRVHSQLPEGIYNLNIKMVWTESTMDDDPFTQTQYTQSIIIPFEIYSQAQQANHIVIQRNLPDMAVIPGIMFPVTITADPGMDEVTGLILTETLPPELEFVPVPGMPINPDKVPNPLVWLLRNSTKIPNTTIPYYLMVKQGTPAGTVIRMNGMGEVLNSGIIFSGDENIIVASQAMIINCPVPNQVLLAMIETWGKWVRDVLPAGIPPIDDLTILQIIERWRNCERQPI